MTLLHTFFNDEGWIVSECCAVVYTNLPPPPFMDPQKPHQVKLVMNFSISFKKNT